MSTETERPSAVIYQFPVGGRRALTEPAKATSEDTRAPRTVMGGAWYHDVAIADTKRAGER
jgi:hypothetical protein